MPLLHGVERLGSVIIVIPLRRGVRTGATATTLIIVSNNHELIIKTTNDVKVFRDSHIVY